MMIKQYIAERNITDVKESQFRYRLGKIKEKMLEEDIDISNLYTVGRIQKNKETNDRVYLFNVDVLTMVYDLLKDKKKKKKIKKKVDVADNKKPPK